MMCANCGTVNNTSSKTCLNPNCASHMKTVGNCFSGGGGFPQPPKCEHDVYLGLCTRQDCSSNEVIYGADGRGKPDVTKQRHYTQFKIQPAVFIGENNIGYFEGNVIKYVCRYQKKNGIEDLKKARHYLDMLISKLETGEVKV